MNISDNSNKFIIELNEFSNNKIKNISEVTCMVELNCNEENKKLFKDIIFTAKYLNGLGRVLQMSLTAPPEDDNNVKLKSAEKVREEYKNNLNHFIKQLELYLLHSDEDFNKEFNNKFLSLNRTSMVNLTTLIYDLSWVKKFLNSKDR
jgi:hypothetical protein